tara:strand:+ start:94 stop:285 length:192 start_codon:yes stop_codon:yes gene_type:complete
MKKTNSIGDGKKNVTVTVTEKQKKVLDDLAAKSNMSRSEYCRAALSEFIESKTYFDKPVKKSG